MSQLNSIEKYALRFLETQHDFVDLKQAQVSGMKSNSRIEHFLVAYERIAIRTRRRFPGFPSESRFLFQEEVEAQKREWMIKSLQHQKEREEALREPPPVLSYKRPHSPEEVKSNGKSVPSRRGRKARGPAIRNSLRSSSSSNRTTNSNNNTSYNINNKSPTSATSRKHEKTTRMTMRSSADDSNAQKRTRRSSSNTVSNNGGGGSGVTRLSQGRERSTLRKTPKK